MSLKAELVAMAMAAGMTTSHAAPSETIDDDKGKFPPTEQVVQTAADATREPSANDALARVRDAKAQQNAKNSRVANPLQCSIHYKGTCMDAFDINEQYVYEIKTKHGSMDMVLDRPEVGDISRNGGISYSQELKDYVGTLTLPEAKQQPNGKWKFDFSLMTYSSEEQAKGRMQDRVLSEVSQYLQSEAMRVYTEQNKSSMSEEDYQSALKRIAYGKTRAEEDLKKMGIVIDAKTGDFKSLNTPARPAQRTTAPAQTIR